MCLDNRQDRLTQVGIIRSRVQPLRVSIVMAIAALSLVGCATTPPAPPVSPTPSSPASPSIPSTPSSPAGNPDSPPIQDDRGSGTFNDIPITSSVFPRTNDQGDYTGKSNHVYWQVVDPDPNGLNCRMGDRTLEEVWNPSAGALDIGSWPVTGTLPPETNFQAALSPGGFVLTFDANNHPWIFVETSTGPQQTKNCFIRANEAYVEPIIPAS